MTKSGKSKCHAAARVGINPTPTVAECCNHFDNLLIDKVLHTSDDATDEEPSARSRQHHCLRFYHRLHNWSTHRDSRIRPRQCHCCQQSVNILSIADNDGTICHQLFIGTDIALMVSEVRPSDEGNERNLRTMDEPRINKELIDN